MLFSIFIAEIFREINTLFFQDFDDFFREANITWHQLDQIFREINARKMCFVKNVDEFYVKLTHTYNMNLSNWWVFFRENDESLQTLDAIPPLSKSHVIASVWRIFRESKLSLLHKESLRNFDEFFDRIRKRYHPI